MSILETILATRRQAVAEAKVRLPQARLEQEAAARRDYRGLAAALEQPGLRIIAEIKRASPSRGPIRPDLDPAALARAYADGGAAALSVLTDRVLPGIAGDLHHAPRRRPLPVLRKDFIFDPYQVYESAAMGADAILLIVRMLDDGALHALHALARQLGLDVLTEAHDARDIARAKALGATLVGINNRDLAHFGTDIGQATRLAGLLNPGTMVMALSGIHTAEDVRQTVAGGIRRILVGEALVRQADPASTLRTWIGRGRDRPGHPRRARRFNRGCRSAMAAARAGQSQDLRHHRAGDRAAVRRSRCRGAGAVLLPGQSAGVTPGRHASSRAAGDGGAVGSGRPFPRRVLAWRARRRSTTVQLHGARRPATASPAPGVSACQGLKTTGLPLVAAARDYPPESHSVECGTARRPGP